MVYPIEIKWETEADATKEIREIAKVVCGMPALKILYYFFWVRCERWGNAAHDAAKRKDVLRCLTLLVPNILYLVPFCAVDLLLRCQERLSGARGG